MFVREAVVAGAFYPLPYSQTKQYLDSVIAYTDKKISPYSIIVPHAGYVYSGHIAAKAYGMIKDFDAYIILGPNHTGLGEEISIFKGVYRMPFGDVYSDDELIQDILSFSEFAKEDYFAHIQEHSIEVQLPFIDYISNKPYKIVPIVVGTHSRYKLKELGIALANAINNIQKDVLIVVSSDMNHYENEDITNKKDMMAIDKILQLDEDGLLDVVEKNNISMCGVACAYCSIVASKRLGAQKASLIEHKTSGNVNGDYSQVVGYASLAIE